MTITEAELARVPWRVGDAVWYAPSLRGPLFRAVVSSEPRILGSYSIVVHLDGLPDAYREYTGGTRQRVPSAEAMHHVFKRAPEDERQSIAWEERPQ